LIEEYRAGFGLRAAINRCGVIAGPWQMGKVDQGVVSLWVLRHYFGKPLAYIGYGGAGKQVRMYCTWTTSANWLKNNWPILARGMAGWETSVADSKIPLRSGTDRHLP